MKKLVNFTKECIGELKKVVWPSRADVTASVGVVLVSTVIIALFLGLLDSLFVAGMSWVF